MEDKREVESSSDRRVCYVIVAAPSSVSRFRGRDGGVGGGYVRRSYPARCSNEVVVFAHATNGFNNLAFVIRDDLDAL